MKAPAFWWEARPGLAARLLSPAGAIVGAITVRRMAQPVHARLPVPVICVGNPTVGGAGKTPVAIAIAKVLRAAGASPVFLSRGYGGRLRGPLVVETYSAAEVGDEPVLLARHAPAVIARDRAAGGALAATLGDVVVMDDGFQNPALHKDLALLLVDGAVGLGNGRVTPAGPLRAPFAPQAARADMVLCVDAAEGMTRCPDGAALVRLVPSCASSLHGVRVLAFAGIGRPEKFFASARALGAHIEDARSMGDHAFLSDRDARQLCDDAQRRSLTLLTTQKDIARLSESPAHRHLAAAAKVVTVEATLPASLEDAVTSVWRQRNRA